MKFRTQHRSILTIISLALLLGIVTVSASCSSGEKKEEASEKVSRAVISDAAVKLPRMVDFKSPTCPPCRAMEPILAELSVEYAHAFELVLIDVSKQENQQIAAQNAIQYIPTQLFYDENGKQIFRHTGYYSKQDILNKWKELGYVMSPKE